jgi:hypothetical protein
MSRFDLMKRKDASIAKEIDKDCTNKWCWSWLDKKVDDEAIGTWCDKVKESGKAYCSVCRVEVRYDSGGVRALTDHAKSR